MGYFSKIFRNKRLKDFKKKQTKISSYNLWNSNLNLPLLKRYSNLLILLGVLGFLIYGFQQGTFLIGRGGTRLAGDNAYIYLSINLFIPAILLKYVYLKEAQKKSVFFIIFFIFTAYLYTVLGGRYRLVILLVSFGYLFFYYNKIRFGRSLSLILSFTFVYVISIIGANRSSVYFGSDLSIKNADLDVIISAFISSSGDLNIFDTFVKIYEGIPSIIPYHYGTTFLGLIVQPIPRTLFPGKPQYASQIIMENLMPQYYERGIGFAGSILADFMLNFGVIGIFVGMFLSGVVIRKLSSLKYQSHFDNLFFAISLSVIPFYVRGEFVGTSVWYLLALIPALFYFVLCRLRFKK